MRQRIQITSNFLLYKIGQTLCVKDFSFFGELQRFSIKNVWKRSAKNHPGRFCFKKTSYSTVSQGIQFFSEEKHCGVFRNGKKAFKRSRGSPALSAFFLPSGALGSHPKRFVWEGLAKFSGDVKKQKKLGGKKIMGAKCEKNNNKKTHLSQNMRFFRKQNPSSEIAQFTFCLLCWRN